MGCRGGVWCRASLSELPTTFVGSRTHAGMDSIWTRTRESLDSSSVLTLSLLDGIETCLHELYCLNIMRGLIRGAQGERAASLRRCGLGLDAKHRSQRGRARCPRCTIRHAYVRVLYEHHCQSLSGAARDIDAQEGDMIGVQARPRPEPWRSWTTRIATLICLLNTTTGW